MFCYSEVNFFGVKNKKNVYDQFLSKKVKYEGFIYFLKMFTEIFFISEEPKKKKIFNFKMLKQFVF